ncbi:thiamine-phosphate diphosphorylase [Nitrosomonas aestuarii]|uniref:Thiamine-phosphate synthase n=1 Tax=Nitrosomonas aestuarii TaxID=52441 RepID=A0A1I3XVC6_9PROT|nr:thiamine phosphate synthase [Nitrosomonas aestuarii]SFK23229.1 thiamine-phosphate diphosphorylase [Nitrosomonas aestuarii]
MKKRNQSIRGLYGITPDLTDTAVLLNQTEQILTGGAQLIQYRNKLANKVLRRHQANLLLRLCRTYATPMIVNDHLDLATEIDADGIHVGQSDVDITAARTMLGRDKIIGATCYNRLDLAIQAESKGADYVAFGAFYPTSTKQNTVFAPLDILVQAKKTLTVPIIGIGGINLTNARTLIENGANAVAVSYALYRAKDIHKTAETISRFFG